MGDHLRTSSMSPWNLQKKGKASYECNERLYPQSSYGCLPSQVTLARRTSKIVFYSWITGGFNCIFGNPCGSLASLWCLSWWDNFEQGIRADAGAWICPLGFLLITYNEYFPPGAGDSSEPPCFFQPSILARGWESSFPSYTRSHFSTPEQKSFTLQRLLLAPA